MNQKRLGRGPPTVEKLPEVVIDGVTVKVGQYVTLKARPGRPGGRYALVQVEIDRTDQLLLSVQRGNEPWHYVRVEALSPIRKKRRRGE